MIKKWFLPWTDESLRIFDLQKKSHASLVKGRRRCADYYAYRISKRYRCYIHPNAIIGEKFFLPHPVGVIIGEGVEIGKNTIIYQGVTLGRKYVDKADYPKVGNNVTIYANTIVVGDVKIGDGAIIGCNSVVLRDVLDGEVVSGVVK